METPLLHTRPSWPHARRISTNILPVPGRLIMLLECGRRVIAKVFFDDIDETYKPYSGTITDVVMKKAWIATFDDDV